LKTSLFCLLSFSAVLSIKPQELNKPVALANRYAVSKPIPSHLMYRHFLLWVKDLDSKATAAGVLEPYKFAEPFTQRSGLREKDIDAIRREAYALDKDLADKDSEAKALIVEIRERLRSNPPNRGDVPPLPVALKELQQERETIIKSHISILRAALGRESSANLDEYLAREVAPHISLQMIAVPHTHSDATPPL